MTQIFRSGIPYAIELRRLNEHFQIKPGDLYLHEDIAKVLALDRRSSRYHGVVTAWMKQQRRAGFILSGQGRARGLGVMVCTAQEHTALVQHDLRGTARKARRNAISTELVDIAKLNEQELAQYNLLRREVHAVALSTAQSVKTLAIPAAVSGDNVKLFKK